LLQRKKMKQPRGRGQQAHSKKSFGRVEKRTNSCARSLIYLLLCLATFWTLCCFFHYNYIGISFIVDPYSYSTSAGQSRESASTAMTARTEETPGSRTAAGTTHQVRGGANLDEKDNTSGDNTHATDKHVDKDDATSADDIHIIFSTDCSKFQDWQTLLLFHSSTVVKQPGTLTRIASGCTDQKKKELIELYQLLYPAYQVHFTPDFKTDAKTKQKYDFYNKPYGVLHWLEHAARPAAAGTVVALLDPDFVFLRALSPRMAGQPNTLVSHGVLASDVFARAGRNHPVAQFYGEDVRTVLLLCHMKDLVGAQCPSRLIVIVYFCCGTCSFLGVYTRIIDTFVCV
jgi:hypothetical protein